MCRFYGFSYGDVFEMPIDLYIDLYNAITVIQSEEQMLATMASNHAHYKKSDQEKIWRNLNKKARPGLFESDDEVEPVSMKDFADKLSSTMRTL